MRLNTQNGLALLALVVLGGVLVFFGTRQADAPTEDETTVNEGGALLPEIDTTQVTRFEVRTFPAANADDTAASEPAEVIIERGDDDIWNITQATNATERGTDQATVQGVVDIVADLNAANSFSLGEEQSLADFGLAEPRHEILLVTADETHRLRLGNKNPAQTRYYVLLGDSDDPVYTVVSDLLDNVVRLVNEPPYVPPPTPTPTATATPNPYSEVEQTATAQAVIEQAATDQAAPAGPQEPTEAPAETDE